MGGETLTGNEIEARMGTVRNPAQLREMWTSWNDNVGSPMRAQYARMAEIANQGARELGFADTGAMWRSNYDMTPDEFAALTERLWNEVKPLYEQIHCFARAGLNRRYGDAVQPATGPIRADLLGNLWAQEWGNIYDVVAPPSRGRPAYDLTQLLEPRQLHAGAGRSARPRASSPRSASRRCPQTFWERSMITQPRDREVICHASAWDVDNVEDLRIKMCTRVNADDFVTVHHELGHNFYQRAYNRQPFLYLNSANDGFHEAIGDTIALSVTPEYLVQIGLLRQNQMPNAEQDRALLLRQALDKIAFLPFGLLIDRYRWGIFSGQIRAGRISGGVGSDAAAISGHRPAEPAHRAEFRRRRQISRAGERALHALFPRPHPAVPVLQGGVRHCRLARAAAPLLLLRQSRGRPAAERDAGAWARRGPGRTRSKPSPAAAKCRPSRWSNISGRCWAGFASRTGGADAAGNFGLALALAVPVLAGDAGAQAVTTAPLAASEVLLEVNATGSVTTRADLVTLRYRSTPAARPTDEARRKAEAQIRAASPRRARGGHRRGRYPGRARSRHGRQ